MFAVCAIVTRELQRLPWKAPERVMALSGVPACRIITTKMFTQISPG